MADINILGPAKKLLRVRERAATIDRVEGIFGVEGPAMAVEITFRLGDSGARLAITMGGRAWCERRERVDRAFVFAEDRR